MRISGSHPSLFPVQGEAGEATSLKVYSQNNIKGLTKPKSHSLTTHHTPLQFCAPHSLTELYHLHSTTLGSPGCAKTFLSLTDWYEYCSLSGRLLVHVRTCNIARERASERAKKGKLGLVLKPFTRYDVWLC